MTRTGFRPLRGKSHIGRLPESNTFCINIYFHNTNFCIQCKKMLGVGWGAGAVAAILAHLKSIVGIKV